MIKKKKEYLKAENYRKKIKEEIGDLSFQRALLEQELAKVLKKEKHVMSYLHIFSELKRVLLDGYGINIEEGIKELAKLIHDFEENGYEAKKIIGEYTSSLSLKWQIGENENKVKELQGQRNSLQNLVLSLESQANMHRQTMGVYGELEAMNFGLAELKQIWNTISEIAAQTRRAFITGEDAVSTFIKDIEKNYHDNFLFEDKVKEKRKEFFLLEQEVNNNRLVLQLIPFVGITLQRLFQKGISENDIININQIVTEFASNNSQFEIQSENSNSNNSIKKDNKAGSYIINNSNGNINGNRTEYWKSFINQLKKLGDVNLSVNEQQGILEKINKEITDLNKQKQELSIQCQTAISFTNIMTKQVYYFSELIDHYYKTIYKKIKTPSTLSPLPINIIYINFDKQDKDNKEEDGKK